MVARPYLRTPRSVIVQTTALARRKRHEFARAVAKGLVPPETPPTLRKLRRRNYRVLAIDASSDAVSFFDDVFCELPLFTKTYKCHMNLFYSLL